METISKYGILTRRTELRLHDSDVLLHDNPESQGVLVKEAGTLLKIIPTQSPEIGNGKLITVQVLDFVRYDPMHENLYKCPQANLRKVSEHLWPYVITIKQPERRLKLVQKEDHSSSYVRYIKLDDLVSVSGEAFGRNSYRYDCIVRYIGPVEELRPVGYFFGLELLHLESGHSPQSEEIPFSIKYMRCDPSLAIFTTADWISPLSSEVKKKFSPFDLLSGTLEKFRTAIGPNICVSAPSNTSSLRREKKEKKIEATAQFYVTPTSPDEETTIPQDSNMNVPDSLTFAEMDRKTQQLAKASEPNSNQIISLGNEEFKQSVENYANSVERQYGSNTTIGNPIPNTQAPAGILKHGRTSSSVGKDSFTSKPTTIMSLEDRDLVVIDNADIRECTKHEVIVVDDPRQQNIDLVDLLGPNWPTTAGNAAPILNNAQKQQIQQQLPATSDGSSHSSLNSVQTKTERNKSSNPISHIAMMRSSDRTRYRENQKIATTCDDISSEAATASNTPGSNDAAIVNNEPVAEGALVNSVAEVKILEGSPLQEIPNTVLGVGSMVEISVPEVPEDLYGVVRWIGVPPETEDVVVGVELEDDQADKQLTITDGSFNGIPLFKCHERRALFVTPDKIKNDRRFVETDGAIGGKPNASSHTDAKMFGQVECPSISGAIAPLKVFNVDELEAICGKFKGIQGHHNSCYLDATLFSMFTFTSVFDSLLFRPPEQDDIPHYVDVQTVLREEIVNPLRKNVFVRADRVMKLRQLLDKLSSVSGLTSEEKDPEEFLNSLLAQIMRVEPFLKLSSGQDAFFYQLFVEKDERLSFPTVQQLFEQSFHSSDIKLKEVPSCLIIQMPRFGKNYKMYPRILPSQVLDVTDIIEDSPRQCSVCGKLAEYECHDCFGILQGVGLESTAFCRKCRETVHMHAKRANHKSKKLSVPQDFRIMAEHMNVPRLYMELFAVVCIETSHYVAFVKAGSGPDAPWCFFDSMADRKGEKNGYNIPEMITVPDLPQWLSEEGARVVNETSSNDKMLPEHAKRLFCDAYMCMYQSTDVMMYR